MLGTEPERRESHHRGSGRLCSIAAKKRGWRMTGEKRITDLQDIQVLYDLAIYNYEHFGIYKMLIYEDAQHEEAREYTNLEVAREATQLAAGLRALGIQKGDRVIVMMINSPEVIIAYQAIARAGAIIVPVLPLLKGPEVRYIAENSAAKAIITSAILLPLLQNALAEVSTMEHIIATGIEARDAEADQSAVGAVNRPLRAYRDVLAMGTAYADRFLEDLEGVSL